ncbi:putative P-loop containing nucleoside triphosphate hydrolase protein [Lyophyllum shimeji]|uniref:P-loop containing nucleoside triphosphate hydrolase protein n=1 Tax=Lyophyllum shimeji TaxID=47721 RepID=A0A9P3PGJ4_LYOSH|nr:putative P-loop containing nucleoside triphosphate hydrolase protein [Lyophyllum shimeji]
MDALKSLIQPLVGGAGGSSVVDGMKLVVLGGTVETARRVSSSAWSHFVNSFFLTAHFSEEDYPYDWLMLWLSRRPEWQRSREFETTTRSSGIGADSTNSFGEEDFTDEPSNPTARTEDDDDIPGKVTTRVVFQPTFDTTHTIYYRGHWLRVRRGRKTDGSGTEMLSISVVARSNLILKQLVLQAKKEYEAEAIHRIQIYFADSHGSWRWTDSRHKRPMQSIVLNPGVKEMLLNDAKDFLKSEKWYADRGIPFRRGYLLHGVPGSGKSSLIHAIAGQLMLDIYVVSLSASWISDSTLTTLMGRVPARCILLLEDLDAAFVRSSTRENSNEKEEKKEGPNEQGQNNGGSGIRGGRNRRGDQLSDVNTLSLSGLLNALDGVAAAEGRLLFATTNHLDRLDPALSRPGRMDVWVEFKNASKWQAEALFRNFFPSTDDDPIDDVPPAPSTASSNSGQGSSSRPTSTLWSMSPSFSSSSVASSFSSTPLSSPTPSSPVGAAAPLFPTNADAVAMTATPLPQFGASNQAYLPPPVEEQILASQHSAKPLDSVTLGILAKKFADGVPEEEFSVAALQGYLLRNKSQPEAAANGVEEWVRSEREMRERLKREKEEREEKERLEREKRKQKAAEKEAEKKELEKMEQELEKMRQLLAEKEKERKEQEKEKDSEKEKAEKEAKAAAEEAARKEEIRKKELEVEEARKKREQQQQEEDEEDSESESEDSDSENIPVQAATKAAWT